MRIKRIYTFTTVFCITVECFTDSAPGSFDCIFMDVMIPVMDGLESAGMNAHLTKPLEIKKYVRY